MLKFVSMFGVAALFSAATALAVPTVAAHTTVVVFDARTANVTARESGYCWTASIASARSDAYRCMVGNSIHDPCFERSQHEVVCPTDASENRGIAIELSKPLPQANQARSAWQMQLVSGSSCNAGTGTTIPGYPFYCTGGLVCSAPPADKQQPAVFVRCATVANGKLSAPGSYLVRILYE